MDFRVAGGRGWTYVWVGLLKRRESYDNVRGKLKKKFKKEQSLVLLIFQSMGALLNQRQLNEIWVLSDLKICRKEIIL